VPNTPISLFLVMLVDADGLPVAPPFTCTHAGDDTTLAAELARVFADDDDVQAALIAHLSSDPEEIADAILAASDPFGDDDDLAALV
jgi:hypothetical protein